MLRSVKYGLYGTVMAGLIAAPVAWNSVDKTVELSVDGKTTAVHTTASTVRDVLRDQGLRPGEHDIVAPSLTSRARDGMQVVVRQGRLLNLRIDGQRMSVWTTAPTVAQALDELGYTSNDLVSVSRSRRLPLTATDIAIRTPRLVTVVHDGRRQMVTTTDTSVGQVLTDMHVSVGSRDLMSAAATDVPTPGMVVTIRRVTSKTTTELEKTSYDVRQTKDTSRFEGDTHVVTPGHKGRARVTYSVLYLDGKEIGRTQLKSVTVSDPTTQVVEVGTRKITKPPNTPDAGSPDPGTAKDIAKKLLPSFGFGAQEQYDCLVAMWTRESGWRTNAANPSGAYGIPQALPGSKMSSAGPDWQTDAATQIKWGLGYIKARYETPCGAWTFWQGHNYY